MTATDSASVTYATTLCGPLSYTISAASFPVLSIDNASGILTLESNDPTMVISPAETITISASLDDYPSIPAAAQTFNIEVVDSCATTMITITSSVVDMQALVSQGPAVQIVTATDSASVTFGGVPALCGPISYTISPTSYITLSLASDTLTLFSNDPAEVMGPQTITISALLDNYLGITAAS